MAKKARNNSETSCDDKHLLNKENHVKERWKIYFESIFACKEIVADDNITTIEHIIDDRNESQITMDKIMKALKRMKVGKAAEYDRVSSEILRSGEVKWQVCCTSSLTNAGKAIGETYKANCLPGERARKQGPPRPPEKSDSDAANSPQTIGGDARLPAEPHRLITLKSPAS
ncbi:hypothetical protein EVAR_46934_1 [Eumeta japonica]|uniref:Uncharacterized protein n=1 Tax=Eumeta variegata TaxID=151549 RepID=A0A4C2A1X7_EUMVA|nr:hypothetical protein EVAR_46934_1 [Eumeta japonica]